MKNVVCILLLSGIILTLSMNSGYSDQKQGDKYTETSATGVKTPESIYDIQDMTVLVRDDYPARSLLKNIYFGEKPDTNQLNDLVDNISVLHTRTLKVMKSEVELIRIIFQKKNQMVFSGDIKYSDTTRRTNASGKLKKLTQIAQEDGSSAVLIAKYDVYPMQKNNGYYSWNESHLVLTFVLYAYNSIDDKMKKLWESKQHDLYSLNEVNIKQGRVNKKNIQTVNDELATLELKKQAASIQKIIKLTRVNKSDHMSFFFELGGAISGMSKDFQSRNVFGSLSRSLGISTSIDNLVKGVLLAPKLRMAWSGKGKFFVGFFGGFDYLNRHVYSAYTFSDIGATAAYNTRMSYGGGLIFATTLGKDLSRGNTLLIIEPGVMYTKYTHTLEYDALYIENYTGMKYKLDFSINGGIPTKTDINKFGVGNWYYNFYAIAGLSFIPKLQDKTGKTLYYQEGNIYNGNFYVSDGSVLLPDSKQASMFNFHIGVGVSIFVMK